MKKIFLILILLGLLNSHTVAASVLSDAADALKPGTWTSIQPSGAATLGQYGLITGYADSGTWNPETRQIFFRGSYHYHESCDMFAVYTESTHTWTKGPSIPTYADCVWEQMHAYDHNTIDQANGDFYFHLGRDNQTAGVNGDLFKFNIATQTWTTMAQNTQTAETASGQDGFVWFPEMNAIIINDALGKVYKWDQHTNTWSTLATGVYGQGGTWRYAEYNQALGEVYFGTPDRLFRLKADGTITERAAPPITLDNHSHFTADPASRKFIAMQHAAGDNFLFREYDPDTNTWTANIPAPPTSPTAFGGFTAAIPISTHGVIAYLHCTGNDINSCNGTLFLYKHTAKPTADANYASRCSGSGVKNCLGFNTLCADRTACDVVKVSDDAVYGNLFASNDGVFRGSVDSATKVSGAGALRFTVPANLVHTGSPTGQYTCCGSSGAPSAQTQSKGLNYKFQAGGNMYVQYTFKMDAGMLASYPYWGAPSKLAMFFIDNNSYGPWETTINSKNLSGQANIYMNTGDYEARTEADGATLITDGNQTPYLLQQGHKKCAYGYTGDCWHWPTDKWITVLLHIKIPGTTATFNTNTDEDPTARLESWYSVDGLPYVKWINISKNMGNNRPWNCRYVGGYPNPCPDEGINNFSFIVYTNGMTAPSPYEANIWYDEVIVSTEHIPAPIIGSGLNSAPASVISGKAVFTGKVAVQ